jgi:hypothetical protein
MTNLTRAEIIEFGANLEGVEVVEEQVSPFEGKTDLVVRAEGGGALYTSTSDAEAYAWLCGYAWAWREDA